MPLRRRPAERDVGEREHTLLSGGRTNGPRKVFGKCVTYRKLATLLRGHSLEIGLRTGDDTINPFTFEPTPEHLHFLHAFARFGVCQSAAVRSRGWHVFRLIGDQSRPPPVLLQEAG
jgi:hypothetical protein